MPRHRLAIPILALLSAAIGCSPNIGNGIDPKQVETQVAGTLTAIADQAATPEATPEPQDLPTATPTESVSGPSGGLTSLRVAYLDNDIPWLWEQGSPPVQLTTSGNAKDVLLSDDGQVVVFVRQPVPDDASEIRAINADGSHERTLMTSAQLNGLVPLNGFLHNDVSQIAFIPGTHQLLMNSRAVAEGPGLIKHNNLLRIDADSGEVTTILAAPNGGDFVLAPDGSWLALIQPDTVGLVRPDGTNLMPDLIKYENVITYSEFQYYAQPVWNLDSSALMVTIPSPDPLADDPTGTTYRIEAESGSVTELGTIAGDLYFSQVFTTPSPAPTHDRLGFVRIPSDAAARLVLANPDGSGETVYTTGDLEWRGWSPDGSHFLFSLGDPMSLHLGQPGSPPAPLVTGTEFTWIGADRFLFLSGDSSNWTLRLGEIGGPIVEIAAPVGSFVQFAHAAP